MYVPKEHVGQIMKQMTVMSFNFFLYVKDSECGILYKRFNIVAIRDFMPLHVNIEIHRNSHVKWASGDSELPGYTSKEQKDIFKYNLYFWKVVNNCVRDHGTITPIEVLKHTTKSLHSKTKGGLDGKTRTGPYIGHKQST